jgi:hypothetical protein
MRTSEPEIPLRAKRCENCAAFEPGDKPRRPSQCRAGLPTLLLSPGAMGQTGIAGVWVPTDKSDWCLQHKSVEN